MEIDKSKIGFVEVCPLIPDTSVTPSITDISYHRNIYILLLLLYIYLQNYTNDHNRGFFLLVYISFEKKYNIQFQIMIPKIHKVCHQLLLHIQTMTLKETQQEQKG